MTDYQIQEIEERANAATPGPWIPSIFPISYSLEITGYAHAVKIGQRDWTVGIGEQKNWETVTRTPLPDGFARYEGSGRIPHDLTPNHDAQFIAHAREDIPALIAEIRRLRGGV